MSDILLLQERVKNTISVGESHFREFKSAFEGPPNSKRPRSTREICKDVAEALVAFANADGGELLVGIEDDGQITGVPHSEEEINQMLTAPKSHVHAESHLPMIQVEKLVMEGGTVLYFSVAKGSTEIFQLSDGRCVCRKDRSTVPIAVKNIQFERQEVKSREYDRQFVDGSTVNDLDVQIVQALADNYLKGLSVERYLQQTGLADYASSGLRLRMAAVLLFAKDIQRWHPRCQIRILRIAGTQLRTGESYNVKSDEMVRGNISELLVTSWEQLRPFLAYKTDFGPDAKFEQRYLYPEGACREALINAIAHRDYSIQNGIEIFIFDDHLEIKSPGALLSTLTLESIQKLEGAHESRNVLISKILRENKYMRELGEGIKRIFELMEQSELDKPILCTDSNSFSVTLTHKSVFSTQQEQWLALYDPLNLTPRQKKIVVAGMNGREISPNDIYRAMNTEDRDTYDREVTGLRLGNILVEIRTNMQAKNYAHFKKIKKGEVPRFKVNIPKTALESAIERRQSDSHKRNPILSVFIYNIAYTTTSQEIKDVFGKCGVVDDIYLPLDPTHRPKGFGFITFGSSDSARRAIQELNGVEIGGRHVYVVEYEPSKTTGRGGK